VADSIDILKDEMPGGELALIVCLVAGACFVLGAFAMWLFLKRSRRWRSCRRRRSKRRKRDRRKSRQEAEGRVVWDGERGVGDGGWVMGSEERSGRRMGRAREGVAEEGAVQEVNAEECLGGIY